MFVKYDKLTFSEEINILFCIENRKDKGNEPESEKTALCAAVHRHRGVPADTGFMKKYLRKADILLIAGLIAMGFAGLLLMGGGTGSTVCVRHNGEVIYEGKLSQDYRIEVDGKYHNSLVIDSGSVYMERSDCPGGDCLHQGRISRAGSMIACAPNGVIVTVTDRSAESGVDAVAG